MLNSFNAPIIAIATATGSAGIGIIRISGQDGAIVNIARELFGPSIKLDDKKVSLRYFRDDQGNQIDRLLVIYFKSPFSYTGESVLELQAHGGQALLSYIMEQCINRCSCYGLRFAGPGEFTERAFLNGKIDLVQAEAVADLISARSRGAIRAANRSLNGSFSKLIDSVNEHLINLRIEVEATLDFPEEEIDFITEYKCVEKLKDLMNQVKKLLGEARQGEILRDGLRVALVGNTNVGKSSLLNQLAGDDVAIVSEVAGTTRDKIQSTILIDGIPFHIVDTAGIRQTEDLVEKIGIERTRQEISKADIVLQIRDIREREKENPEEKIALQMITDLVKNDVPILTVLNKSDLVEEIKPVSGSNEIVTSALTGQGIDKLRQALLKYAGWEGGDSVILARDRHIVCLNEVLGHLEKALRFVENDSTSVELFAEELRIASDKLGEIVGKTTSEDLLDKIFSGFCIGK